MKTIIVLAGVVMLAGCSSLGGTATVTDAAACAAELVAAGVVNPSSIISTAVTSPACKGLASDVLAQLEALAAAKAGQARAAMHIR